MKVPEGVIVNAIWRCKRGHESPAAWSCPNGDIVPFFRTLAILLEDGSVHNVCIRCLVEDYGTERVEFKEG